MSGLGVSPVMLPLTWCWLDMEPLDVSSAVLNLKLDLALYWTEYSTLMRNDLMIILPLLQDLVWLLSSTGRGSFSLKPPEGLGRTTLETPRPPPPPPPPLRPTGLGVPIAATTTGTVEGATAHLRAETELVLLVVREIVVETSPGDVVILASLREREVLVPQGNLPVDLEDVSDLIIKYTVKL